MFTPDCAYLTGDAVFGVKPSLIADFARIDDPAAATASEIANPFWRVDWTFVLVPQRPPAVTPASRARG